MQNLHTVDGSSVDCGIDHRSPFYDKATDSEIVAFKLEKGAALPTRGSEGAAGYDICIPHTVRLPLNRMVMVDTGIRVASPVPMLLLARSSLVKRGIRLANGVGLIDQDYRGTIQLPLIYEGFERPEPKQSEIVEGGTALAQLVFFKAWTPTSYYAPVLDQTVRGNGGFGSTDQ